MQGLRKRGPIRRLSTRLIYFVQENWRRIWVLALWALIMIGLFTWKFLQYKQKNAFKVMGYCLPTAKGAAETLKLNMALILLPMCRNTITWLRSTRLGYSVPFDDNVNFHKVHPKSFTNRFNWSMAYSVRLSLVPIYRRDFYLKVTLWLIFAVYLNNKFLLDAVHYEP